MPTRLRTGLDRARDLRDDAERHGRASACRRYRSASFSRDGHERRAARHLTPRARGH